MVAISNSVVPLISWLRCKAPTQIDYYRLYLRASAAFNAYRKSTYTRNQLNPILKKAATQVKLSALPLFLICCQGIYILMENLTFLSSHPNYDSFDKSTTANLMFKNSPYGGLPSLQTTFLRLYNSVFNFKLSKRRLKIFRIRLL